jgi:hypothetical protein
MAQVGASAGASSRHPGVALRVEVRQSLRVLQRQAQRERVSMSGPERDFQPNPGRCPRGFRR